MAKKKPRLAADTAPPEGAKAQKLLSNEWIPEIPKPVKAAAEALKSARLAAADARGAVHDCETTLEEKMVAADLRRVQLSDGNYYELKDHRKIKQVSHKKLRKEHQLPEPKAAAE